MEEGGHFHRFHTRIFNFPHAVPQRQYGLQHEEGGRLCSMDGNPFCPYKSQLDPKHRLVIQSSDEWEAEGGQVPWKNHTKNTWNGLFLQTIVRYLQHANPWEMFFFVLEVFILLFLNLTLSNPVSLMIHC